MAVHTLSAICLIFAASALVTKVTPVEKVTELLKKLQVQVTDEGKEEAAQYDKYACFCKEQADTKQYNIEKSTKLIAELAAKIGKLDTEIAKLNTEVSTLSTTITGKEDTHKKLTAEREAGHEDFMVRKTNLESAIAAVEGAIETLTSAKGDLTEAKLTGTVALLAKLAPQKLALIQRSSQPGKPAKYQYHSNDIISLLEDLLETFKGQLKDLEQEEFTAKSIYDSEAVGLTNEVAFAKQDKAEKEELSSQKTEEKETTQADKDEETADMNADKDFLAVLVADCEEKASLFDQRSSTRADELKAIAGAIETITTGVAPNWSANKMLVDLQLRKSAKPHLQQPVAQSHRDGIVISTAGLADSFLQVELEGGQRSSEAVSKAYAFLAAASTRLRSSVLTAAAIKIESSKDHFVKVRGLIKDLIAKLEATAAAEADTKSLCDKEMNKSITQRDEATSAIEAAEATIAKLTTEIATLKMEISDLAEKIASNMKALAEATELRDKEKAENEKVIADATEGKEATELALKLLEDFYNTAFLQYVPPNVDREGKTVEDLSPEVFDSKYHGKQTDAHGIIGILQVILSDFERTLTTTKDDEEAAQAEFDKFKGQIEKDTAKAKATKEKKETSVATKESEKVEAMDDAKSAKKRLETALAKLEDLKSMCVDLPETYEDRKKKREEEIAALKEAMQILIDWQS